MNFDHDEIFRDAEDHLESSNALRNVAISFIVLTSLFLAWHSVEFFHRMSGGGRSGYIPALLAVGCVEASLVGLIVAHFKLFTTGIQRLIGLFGEVFTYCFLLFHASLNFRMNLFGYVDGFGQIYQENGLPVLIFGVTLLTWTAILLTDVRVKIRIESLKALSKVKVDQFRAALKNRVQSKNA